MPKHSNIRRFFIKLGMILFALWFANIFIGVSFGDGSSYDVRAAAGAVQIMTGPLPDYPDWGEYTKGFDCRIRTTWSEQVFYFLPEKRIIGSVYIFLIPIWWLGLPFMLYSLVAFLPDTRRPANACQYCGYNLTGNVSGICPECGKPIEREKLTSGRIR